MQHTFSNSEAIKAREVLSFSGVELLENIHGTNKITEVGILRVLYFPHYNQFILELEDWCYALLKQIPVTVQAKEDCRCYIFPNYSGFLYILKLRKIPHLEALQNFETILSHNTSLSLFQDPVRHRISGPARIEFAEYSDISPSSAQSSLGSSVDELRSGEKIKKGFKKIASMLSGHYNTHQYNVNLVQAKDYESLKLSGVEIPRSQLIKFLDIEQIIKRGRDIAGSQTQKIMCTTSTPRSVNQHAKVERAPVMKPIDPDAMIDDNEAVDQMFSYTVEQVLEEIEKEKVLQYQERCLREEHRRKEMSYIEQEREFLNLIRKQNEEEFKRKEQGVMAEILKRDMEIAQQAKERELELLEFERNEKLLQAELQRNLSLIYEQEKLMEEERFRFSKRGMELIQESKQLDLIIKSLEGKQEELLKVSQLLEQEYQASLRVSKAKRIELEKKQREINLRKAETEELFIEIKEKEKVLEVQLPELLNKREEISNCISRMENDISELRFSRLQKEKKIEEELLEIREKERMLEIERAELEQKYAQFVKEIEQKREGVKDKEKLTEAEYIQLILRQEKLKETMKIRESELLIVRGKASDFQKQSKETEIELCRKIEATEKEQNKLRLRKEELSQTIHFQNEQIKCLEERNNELLNEIEQKKNVIAERERMVESELDCVDMKQKDLQKEFLGKLKELSEQEKLVEKEHLDLQNRLKELVTLENLRGIETEQKLKLFDRLRLSESKLVSKSVKLIESHQILGQELLKVGKGLEETEKDEIITRNSEIGTVEVKNADNTEFRKNHDNKTDSAILDTTNITMHHFEA